MLNRTLFQFFHWYYSPEGNLWNHCREEAAHLSQLGVSDIWLPPAYKSAKGIDEPGYAVYDLYDLGEFDQKGTVRTRYGTKDEYLACIRSLHDEKIAVLADIVLNHKHGGDEQERIPVVRVKDSNRNEAVSDRQEVDAYTRFTFPGRQGKYSNYIWNAQSFTGICEDGSIGLILNEYSNGIWDGLIEEENGNFDYLMGNDIEFRNPYVREELKNWGKWYVETTGVDGFRLDALKHITPAFFPEWLDFLDHHFNRRFFCIGEYWQPSVEVLKKFIDTTGGRIQLFDVPLHHHFHEASVEGDKYDLRTILDNTLIKERPELAISFVDNHDTQPLQSLQLPVEAWFRPIAYAFILLREQGIPCVFYPDIYDAKYAGKNSDGQDAYIEINRIELVVLMMKIRHKLAYGIQRDYFDDPHLVGWVREGSPEITGSGCAVLVTNTGDGEKWMSMGKQNAGKTMIDATRSIQGLLVLNEDGAANFWVKAGSVSIWIEEKSQGAL